MSKSKSKKPITATFRAKGHLIDSGLMSDALEAVQAAGATYRVLRLDIGKHRLDESELELEVTAPDGATFERVRADLMSLGLSETETQDAVFATVEQDGVAPENFYSSTNLSTEVRIDVPSGQVRLETSSAVTDLDLRQAVRKAGAFELVDGSQDESPAHRAADRHGAPETSGLR